MKDSLKCDLMPTQWIDNLKEEKIKKVKMKEINLQIHHLKMKIR